MDAPLDGAVAVVTGAGGGLGRALVAELRRRGTTVAASDRDAEALTSLESLPGTNGGALLIEPLDVSDAQQVRRYARSLGERFGAVRLLINNAGTGLMGPFAESDPDRYWRVIETNLGGTINCCHAFLPWLRRAAPAAQIVNVSSLGGLVPVPFATAYSASKSAIVGFSQALRAELAGEVGVTVVCPGLTRTNLARNSDFVPGWRSYQVVLDRSLRGEAGPVDPWTQVFGPVEADYMAKQILSAAARNRSIVVSPRSAAAIAAVCRHFPQLAAAAASVMARHLLAQLEQARSRLPGSIHKL